VLDGFGDPTYRELRLEVDVDNYVTSDQPPLVVALDLRRILIANGLAGAFDPESVQAVRRSNGVDVVEYFHEEGGGLFFFDVADPADPDIDVYFTTSAVDRLNVWLQSPDNSLDEYSNVGLRTAADLRWSTGNTFSLSDELASRGARLEMADEPAANASDLNVPVASFQSPTSPLRRRDPNALGIYESVVASNSSTVREFLVVNSSARMMRVITRVEAGASALPSGGQLSFFADFDLGSVGDDAADVDGSTAVQCNSGLPNRCVALHGVGVDVVATGPISSVKPAWARGELSAGADGDGSEDQAIGLSFAVPALASGKTFTAETLVVAQSTFNDFDGSVADFADVAADATSAIVTPGNLWFRPLP
jgi:hypothetical protein